MNRAQRLNCLNGLNCLELFSMLRSMSISAAQADQTNVANSSRLKKWGMVALASVIVLVLVGLFGFRIAVEMLKERVVAGLGPGSKITELKVSWSSIELIGVDIRAPKGWPTTRMLQAERVTVVPSLRSLLTNEIRIASITIEKPYLSVLRVPGKLLILPNLFETDRRNQKPETNGKEFSRRTVAISRIALENGSMEIFDATVSQPPHKIRLEQIEAVVRDIAPANPQSRTRFEVTGTAKGKTRDGQVKVSGWVGAAPRDSSSHILMESVDLVSLQPYLGKKGDARVSRGTLDMDLKSEVRNNNLDGIGKMIIRQLEFAPSQNYMDTFMGAPRTAVIGFLKDHEDAINIDFTLTGDIRKPNFSLNETLATRVAAGMAGQLGLSLKGVAEGVETLGRKGLEGASGAAGAIGSAFRGFFGGGKQ